MTALSLAARRALSLRTAIAVVLGLAALAAPVRAQTVTWDPATDGSGSGGPGTWNLVLANWYNGANDIAWPNTVTSAALFNGTGGTVSISTTGIQANALTFNVTGYVIDNGGTAANTLTLVGTTPTITVTNATDTATISAIVAGTAGLTKAGAGTLVLSGTNTYTGATTIGGGTLSIAADLNLGAAPGAATAGSLTFTGGGTLTTTATLALASNRGIALGAGGGTLSPAGGTTLTYGGIVAGSGLLTKAGAGTLVLSGITNSTAATGGYTNAAGITQFTAATNLPTGTLTVSGGTLQFTGAAGVTLAQAFTVGAGSGTFDNATKQKAQISAGLAGSGTFTRAASANNTTRGVGAGGGVTNDFQITGTGSFTGAVVLTGGQLETNQAALGTPTSITVNSGAEFSASGTITTPVTINAGGSISTVGGNNTYSGPITVGGNFTIGLGDFYQTTNRNLTIGGNISGTGTFGLLNAATTTAAVGAGQVLTLGGNNAGYTSAVTVPAGYIVAFTTAASPSAGGTVVNSSNVALGVAAFGFDFGATPPTVSNTFSGGASTGGVFAVNTALAATTTLDLSTLGGGTMFLGSQSTGTYAASTLTPSGGTYRLGGGLGTITFSGTNVLTGATAVVAGDLRTNGTGTVVLSGANDYTGATTVNGGTTLSISNGGALGATATGTTVAQGGSLALSGGITVNEPLAVTGTTSAASATNIVNGIVNVSGTNTLAGAVTANTSGNNLRISTTAGTIVLPGSIALSGGGVTSGLVFAGAGTVTQTGTVSGGGSLFGTSSGTSTLSATNTFTGKVQIQQGTFRTPSINSVTTPAQQASSGLGVPASAASVIELGNTTTGGTLVYIGTGETTDRSVNLIGTTGGGTIDQSGTGLLKFTTSMAAGTTGAGAKTFVLQGSSSGTGEFAGAIVDNTATFRTSVTKAGSGQWTLSALNSYTGTTTVNQGTLTINTLTAVGGGNSSLGNPLLAQATIGLGSGTTTPLSGVLQYVGTANSVSDRTINLGSTTGNGTLDQSGTGAFQVGAVTATGAGTKVLVLTGSTTGIGTVGGAIADNATGTNLTGVTKTGTGTWVLAGANTYTGATTISNGVLRVTGSTVAASAVAVNTSGALGGTGTVNGAVTVAGNAGSGIDLRDGAVGTLTLGSTLTFNGTATAQNLVTFDLGSATADRVAATGAVTAATANSVLVGFNQLAGSPVANGTYTILTSTATSNASGFALATTQANGRTYALTGNTASTNLVQVTVGTAAASAATSAVWGGTTSTAWTAAGNWYTDAASGTPTGAVPGVGSNVSFYTTAPAATNLSTVLNADFEINSLTFLGTATTAVTIAAGTPTTSALTIDATAANGNAAGNGISQLAAATHTISSRLGIGGAQTWTVAAGGGLTVSGLVFDTGSGYTLTKAGAGTLTLSGTANTFAGDINVTAGVLAFVGNNGGSGDPLSLGAGNKTITVTNNATLRLLTTSSNATSTNTKRFVVGTGGATFDVGTSGITLQFDDANQFSGTGDLTVTGTGTGAVFLNNQAYNFAGNVTVNSGTLRLGTNSVLGLTAGRTITVNTGGTLDTNNTVTVAAVPLAITLNGGTIAANTASGSFAHNLALTANSFVSAGAGFTETLSGNITGAFSVTKTGAGTTVLSGTNTYGPAAATATIVSTGTLLAAKTVSLPNYATAGQVSVLSPATLALNVGGPGEFAAADVTTLLANGTFATGSGIGFDTTNAGGTFTAPAVVATPSVAALNLTKLGTGTLVLPNANGFGTGSTAILNGTVSATSGATNPLGTGAFTLGTSNGTPANLDLGTSNQTVTTVTVPSNSATANTIAIGAGNTLLATGAVTIGVNSGGTATTRLTVTGATGTFSIGTAVAATNAGVLIGGNTTDLFSNGATVDLSGLGTFFANLGTGTFRVGDATNATGTATLGSTLTLATNSTIIATTITSDSPDGGVPQTIKLGSGTNVFQATTITVGAATNRSNGNLSFNTTTGTLTVRGLAGGATRSTLNVAYGNATTASTPTVTVDLTGHSADLLLASLNVAGRTNTTGGGSSTGTFSFDAGTLDTTGIVVANRAATAAGNSGTSTGTVNLGGGTVTVGATGISVAPNTSTLGTNPTVGTVNISGGAVTVGVTGGTSITLGSSANANGPSTALLNLTGGSLTVAGNIVVGTATGSVLSTLTLDGGTLNMAAKSIGTAAAPVTFNARSGTLSTLGQLNGGTGAGSVLTKTTAGTLTLLGAGTYSGGTAVNAGTLLVNGQTGVQTGTGTGAVSVVGGTLGGSGRAAGAVTVGGAGVLQAGDPAVSGGIGTLTLGSSLTFDAASTFNVRIVGATPAPADSGGSGTPGAGNNFVAVTGAFSTTTAATAWTVNVDAANVTLDPSQTYSYRVAQAGSVPTLSTPTFTQTNFPNVGLFQFALTTDGTNVFVNVAPVPEPATVFGLAAGGLAAAGFVRRRLRAAK